MALETFGGGPIDRGKCIGERSLCGRVGLVFVSGCDGSAGRDQ